MKIQIKKFFLLFIHYFVARFYIDTKNKIINNCQFFSIKNYQNYIFFFLFSKN